MSVFESEMKFLTYVVLLQELLGIVVAVDINLGKGIEDSWVLATGLNSSLEPWENELQAVTGFNLVDELVDGKVAWNRCKQGLDASLVTVNIQETTNDLGSSDRVDALYIDLNEVEEAVLVEVQDSTLR